MDKFIIKGGKTLSGEVKAGGAKNASLALIPAALLASGRMELSNTPELNDVFTMLKLVRHLGVEATFKDELITLDTTGVSVLEAPYEHVKKMRASVYVLGPLLARHGYAKVSLPGGCAWGPRPINLHLEGLKKLGAHIDLVDGYIIAKTKRLKGNRINFDVPSVGATGNLLMAAVLAKGETILNNAAMEPEITNLAEFLSKMGAKIDGIGTPILHIQGVDTLQAADIATIPDRIEAGTLLLAGAITGGKVTVNASNPLHIYSVIAKMEESGVSLKYDETSITVDAKGIKPEAINVTTGPFPGYPTDMQAQWIAYMAIAKGVSTVTDTIYRDRFTHVPELARLGAQIEVKDNSAVVKGSKKLSGAKVMSTDLRASASLVLGGLAAHGITEVLRIYHLDRGYQRLEEKLRHLGADIERVPGTEY
ncbi:UDP-N-acetylglucosamine 1-carboxyvinyltransferase [Ignavibacteriales bacterium]